MGKTPKKIGRPEKATPEATLQAIRLMAGGMSMRGAAETLGFSQPSLFDAIERHGLTDQYAKATLERAAHLSQEALDIADGVAEGCGDVQRDRLRVDTRKWFAARLDPKRWGDKVQAELSGPGGSPIQVTRIEVVAPGHRKG